MIYEIIERNSTQVHERWNGDILVSRDPENDLSYICFLVLSLLSRVPTSVFLAGLAVLLMFLHHRRSCLGDPSSSLPLPPGTMGWPLIGETVSFVRQGIGFFRDRLQTHGPVYKTHLLGSPTIRLVGAEHIGAVQMREHALVTACWPQSAQRLLGRGALSMMGGAEHKVQRKRLTKAFSHQALTTYVPKIQQTVEKHLLKWSQSGNILAYPSIKALMFEISLQVLLGCNLDEKTSTDLLGTFEGLLDNLFSLPIDLPGFGFHKGMAARKKIISTIKGHIGQTYCTDAQRDEMPYLLKGLFEEDTTDEAYDSILELLFTGHGTTSSALCTSIMQLFHHPEVMDRLKSEIEENVNKDGLDFECINRMSLLDNVVKEVLRISPPAGGAFRKVIKTFELDGYQIPAGWTLVYSIRDTHETSGPNPDTFDPDRWSIKVSAESPKCNEKCEDTHSKTSNSFLTFGHGSRACPGREFAKSVMKVFLVELLRKCDVHLESQTVPMKYIPVPHPVDGLPLRVSKL